MSKLTSIAVSYGFEVQMKLQLVAISKFFYVSIFNLNKQK